MPDISIGTLTDGIQQITKFVKAVDELMSAVDKLIPTDSRAIAVEFLNLTGIALTQVAHNFDHGGFGPSLPSARIAPFNPEGFSVVSAGVATGVEGSVSYVGDGITDLLIGFDNPFIGSNSVNVTLSGPRAADLSLLSLISKGNHARARFTLFEKEAKVQGGWRSCPKCQGLHFAGFPVKGVCPAGGQHDQTGSFAYLMLFDSSPGSHMQADWRACSKCQGLFFGPFKGRCPAGGEHDPANSFRYTMIFDQPAQAYLQPDWKSCRKCQGLFFGPFKGRCPADNGPHDESGSFNYILPFEG
jgi:hypothetical protein